MPASYVSPAARVHELHITTDTQASDEDVETIKEAFGEYFRVSVGRTIPRFPESVLPMVISFTIDNGVDGDYYNALGAAILKLLRLGPSRINRRFYVEAEHKRGTAYISLDHLQIRWPAGHSQYSTLYALFEELKQSRW